MALFLQTGIHHEGICSIVYSEEGLYINHISNPAPGQQIDKKNDSPIGNMEYNDSP